jgi:hypothetical protein
MNVFRPTAMKARRSRTRLELQSLEARDVPATVLDLTTLGASVTANGAIINQAPATTDPAQFNTFLRLDASGTEEGYNTDARPFQFDQLGGLAVTHSLKLVDVPVVNFGGTDYREFYLHISESASGPRITLDDLRFFVAEVGNLRNYRPATDTLGGQTAVFNMDGAGNVSVRLDDRLNGTTGKGDAFVYIPSSVFGNATYVYLYSKFGGPNNANGQPEEWGVRPVPPPATASISGNVFADINGDGTWEPNDPLQPEPGVNGYSILLERLDGPNWVTVETKVAQNGGSYSFTGLVEGTYRITKIPDPSLDQQLELQDGWNTVGSAGGTDENFHGEGDNGMPDRITDIILADGVSAAGYNWAMLPNPGGNT